MKYYFRCPKCGNDEQFIKPSEQTDDLGCALFFYGGLIPGLLFANHASRRIQCTRCAHLFSQPALPSSPVASFAGWIVALTIVPIVAAVFVFCVPDLASLLPSIPVIATIEEAFAAQPRVAAYLLAVLLVLIVLFCWGAACLSNVRFRRRFSSEYLVRPLSPRDLAARNNLPPDAPNESRDA